MREADLASSDESASTTLVKYTEGAPSPTPVSPVAQQKQLKLNALGTQGWELVAVQEGCMIFRRSTN